MNEGRNRRNDPDYRGSFFDDAAEGSRSQSGGRGFPHDQGQGRYPAYGNDRSRDTRRMSDRETYEGGFGESNFGNHDGGIDRSRYGEGRYGQRGNYGGDYGQGRYSGSQRTEARNPVEQAWGGSDIDDLEDEWGPSSWNPPQRARPDWRDEEFRTGQPGSGNRWSGAPSGGWRNESANAYGRSGGQGPSGGMRGDAGSYRAGSTGRTGNTGNTGQAGGADRWQGSDSAYDQFTGVNARGSQRSQSRQRTGPKGYQRSDERILEDVCERLTHSDYHVAEVEVTVSGGIVTLSGQTRSRDEKYRLEDVAMDTFGVKDVENRLRTGAASERQGGSTGVGGGAAGSTGGSGVSGLSTGSAATEDGNGDRAGLQSRKPGTQSPGDNLH